MVTGRIIKNISDTYTVLCNDVLYDCKARGKFRNEGLTPLVGDIVEFREDERYILKIEKRRNELKRPAVSNVDIALIVTSLKKPDISFNLLDKEICSVLLQKVEPVICFTKLDLITKEELKELKKMIKYYESLNIKIFTNENLKGLGKYLKDKYVVLTGQTGAGKSSLINRMNANFNLKEGEISEALGRGKHTTRHTEFHEVNGAFIADTPGFSALDLSEYKKEDIKEAFLEFRECNCEFKDCMHINEQNCEVKKKVEKEEILKSRYDNYCSFVKKVD